MSWLKRKYSGLLTEIAGKIRQKKPVYEDKNTDPINNSSEQRLQYYEEKMGQRNLDDVAVRELFNFIRTSAEVDAYRIRVPELARKKG